MRFLQAWVRPDETGTPPSYALGVVDAAALATGWVGVASGEPGALVDLRSRGTTLWVTRLDRGVERALPTGRTAYAHVVRGSVALDVEGAGRSPRATRCG